MTAVPTAALAFGASVFRGYGSTLPEGRLYTLPVGPAGGAQQLVQVDKAADGSLSVKSLMDVRYVPLVSEATTWGM